MKIRGTRTRSTGRGINQNKDKKCITVNNLGALDRVDEDGSKLVPCPLDACINLYFIYGKPIMVK